jgi:hypothetical protein
MSIAYVARLARGTWSCSDISPSTMLQFNVSCTLGAGTVAPRNDMCPLHRSLCLGGFVRGDTEYVSWLRGQSTLQCLRLHDCTPLPPAALSLLVPQAAQDTRIPLRFPPTPHCVFVDLANTRGHMVSSHLLFTQRAVL